MDNLATWQSELPIPNGEFATELAKEIKSYVARKLAPLEKRIAELESRPELKYCGIWVAGKTYAENSLVTHAGSLWIAKQKTASFPGGQAEPGAWQLCTKRGRDGKDAK
jgi:hypothetical protein